MPDDDSPRPSPLRRPVALTLAGLVIVGALLGLGALGDAFGDDEQRRSAPPLAVSSWAPYWQPDSALASFTPNADLFADVSVVAYSATGAEAVDPYPQLPPDMIARFRDATAAAGVPLLATIFDDAPGGTMAIVLANPTTRAQHVETLVALATSGGPDGLGFDGLDLDYEKFAFSDPRATWEGTSANWIAFLTELSARLRPLGKQLVVSVPPVYDGERTDASGYWVYDYAAMATLVDRIRVMTYDYSIAAGEPGPIAPIAWVEDVVEALGELVPPEKIDLGIPTYGYDWVVAVTGACPVDQMPENDPISIARANRTIAERGLVTAWDEETAERRFDYTDTLTGFDAAGAPTTCAVQRTVRYLDADAVNRRALLAHRNDLHGVALWALGNDDATTWTALRAARAGEEITTMTPVG